jgi:uncharacterized protein (DUF1501 family)
MKNTTGCSRRDFLRIGTGTAVTTMMLPGLAGWREALAASADSSGYKAIVCLYLYGGNDGFNWFVPLTQAGYSVYSASRGALALASGSLLPLKGPGSTAATASDGYQYGIHPGCPELQALFDSGNLAVLGNVGTLVAPTTPAQIQAGSVTLPPQLFSHLDQQVQWQTSIPNSPARYGWAGRVADYYAQQGYNPQLAMNIDVGGANYLQQGEQTNMYVLGTSGAPVLDDTSNAGYRNGLRSQAAAQLLSQGAKSSRLMVSEYSAIQQRAAQKVTVVNGALQAAGDLTTAFPSFPGDSELGAQLHEVARMIKAQSQIGDGRQIFFVSLNGFDTHNAELSTQATLMPIMSKNLSAFWAALGELNVRSNVTLFTATDFGRTLGTNGDGSDHAWGNHHIVLGGAVKGGQFYGQMPNLKIGGPNDYGAGLGQMIPTTSTDQYAATMAAWFGVPASQLAAIFPNLPNFPQSNLGFLG